MRVKELIAELQKVDGEAVVETEGCDCDGLAGGLELDDGAVRILRLANCLCEPSAEGDGVQDKCKLVAAKMECCCKRCHPPGSVYP